MREAQVMILTHGRKSSLGLQLDKTSPLLKKAVVAFRMKLNNAATEI